MFLYSLDLYAFFMMHYSLKSICGCSCRELEDISSVSKQQQQHVPRAIEDIESDDEGAFARLKKVSFVAFGSTCLIYLSSNDSS